MKYTIILFLNLIFLLSFSSINAQNNFWRKTNQSKIKIEGERQINAKKFAVFNLDIELLKSQLKSAPLEFTDEAKISPVIIKLPMPEGGFQSFAVVESPVMSDVLSAKFPNIRTYAANGLDDESATLRFDITTKGFHAMIMRSEGSVFIDPYSSLDTENYMVYNKRDFIPSEDKKFDCFADGHVDYTEEEMEAAAKAVIGEELRIYRLAVATTVEYSNYHGGNVESVLSAITTTINRVVGVYRRDLSISMELIDESEDIINIGSDSFTNNDAQALLSQNAQFLNNTIGIGAYDIGHVFSTASGGIASLGCVCNSTYKAYGTTGVSSPIGDPFDIDYVAHEIGHQFGAEHSFNGNAGACSGNRASQSAYEPGSGSTIMAYAGICGSHNIQNNSNDYFHLHSIRQIEIYTQFQTGSNCPEIIETGNTPPVVEILVSNGNTIPISTPFELTGSATDVDNDSLTYCWEQRDLGFAGNPNAPQGNAPLFRSFLPTPDSTRIFPKLADIIGQTQIRGEILPSYTREMEFTLAVRDNNINGGGVSSNFVQLDVTEEAGPFIVTSPSASGTTWIGGEPALIEWDVANTDEAPVNCALVDIYFSTNRGKSFDYLLSAGTANDGTANITLPKNLEFETTQGRIKVKCADNVFFNINTTDIEFVLPKVEVLTDNSEIELCKGDYVALPVYVDVTDGYESNITLSAPNLPTGWTVSFSENPIAAPDTIEMILTTTSNANGVFNVNVNAFSNDLTTVPLALEVAISEEEILTVPPALQAPNDGDNLVAGDLITFSWAELEAATGYAVEIATSPLFTPESIVGNFDGLTQSTYKLSGDTLAQNQLYYWRVYSTNSCQTGINSEVFAFNLQEVDSQNQNPAIKDAEDFIVFPDYNEPITNEFLAVEDDNDAADLRYTLKSLPVRGDLVLDGVVLAIGDSFTQKDIDDAKLAYDHKDLDDVEEDQFTFDLTDGNGGFLYNQVFNIVIDYNFGGISDIINTGFSLYPNPTTDLIQISLNLEAPADASFVLHNSIGQVVFEKGLNLQTGNQKVEMNIGTLPQGVYYYDFNSEVFEITGKVLVME